MVETATKDVVCRGVGVIRNARNSRAFHLRHRLCSNLRSKRWPELANPPLPVARAGLLATLRGSKGVTSRFVVVVAVDATPRENAMTVLDAALGSPGH